MFLAYLVVLFEKLINTISYNHNRKLRILHYPFPFFSFQFLIQDLRSQESKIPRTNLERNITQNIQVGRVFITFVKFSHLFMLFPMMSHLPTQSYTVFMVCIDTVINFFIEKLNLVETREILHYLRKDFMLENDETK